MGGTPALSTLRDLANIINTNLAVLEEACKGSGTSIPDLNQPFHPQSEAFRLASPVAAEASNIVVAAAHHIAAILSPPPVTLNHVVGGYLKSAALRVCLESHVTEILREAGPKGLHVDEISKKNGVDPMKLSRFLRLMAMHHIYREVTPDVFTNTRISSLLDTMKPSDVVIKDPIRKHDNTLGVAALSSYLLDEGLKASAYLWEAVSDPVTAASGDPTVSAFSRSIGLDETLWSYHARPEQQFRKERFGFAMKGCDELVPEDAILKAFPWADLKPGSRIVDVGGGIGSVTRAVAKKFPYFTHVIQDLPSVVEDGKKWWAATAEDAIVSGRVTLEAHDFFAHQPQKNVSVFVLRQILHDWSDDYCIKILSRLREAATPDTKLLILDTILPYACHDPCADTLETSVIPGAVPKEAPAPLLANYGAVNEMGYLGDMIMCIMHNAQERTIHHFDQLLRSTRWKIQQVRGQRDHTSLLQALEAVPV